jgi:hypothetical protein
MRPKCEKVRDSSYDYDIDLKSKTVKTRRGDLIKLPSGYKPGINWVPKNIQGEFAVILSRFRITKYKSCGIFKDYFARVMVLTGKKKGQCYTLCSSNASNNHKFF